MDSVSTVDSVRISQELDQSPLVRERRWYDVQLDDGIADEPGDVNGFPLVW